VTRAIGRRRSEESPVKVAVMANRTAAPMIRRTPVPELPQSDDVARLGQAAMADHPPAALAQPVHLGAEGLHGLGGAHHVVAPSSKPLDMGLTLGKGAQDQGPVGDGFVARRPGAALRRATGAARKGRRAHSALVLRASMGIRRGSF